MTLLELRLFSVQDYHRMIENGILDEDDRVELLAGQIVKMAAKGTAHSAAVGRTEKLFEHRLAERAWVRVQEPVQLNNNSEPEPDIAVVIIDPLDYDDHHPAPSEVYLIVEVSDSTWRYDCGIKAKIYAQSGIIEYWVLDVSDRQLQVFREPSQSGYQSKLILADEASISPLHFPDISFRISEMLRPLTSF